MASPNTQPPRNPDTILTLPNNITVRPLHTNDAASLSHHGTNPAVWNNLRNRMPHPYTEADAMAWISHANDPSNQIRSGAWNAQAGSTGPLVPTIYAIVLGGPSGEAIGNISLDFNDPVGVYFRTAELGYWIGEDYWGRGLMSAVVQGFVDWTWRTFGVLVRLEALVGKENAGSQRCLEKADFVVEGVKKCSFVKNGVVGDEIVMGMIRPGSEKGRAS